MLTRCCLFLRAHLTRVIERLGIRNRRLAIDLGAQLSQKQDIGIAVAVLIACLPNLTRLNIIQPQSGQDITSHLSRLLPLRADAASAQPHTNSAPILTNLKTTSITGARSSSTPDLPQPCPLLMTNAEALLALLSLETLTLNHIDPTFGPNRLLPPPSTPSWNLTALTLTDSALRRAEIEFYLAHFTALKRFTYDISTHVLGVGDIVMVLTETLWRYAAHSLEHLEISGPPPAGAAARNDAARWRVDEKRLPIPHLRNLKTLVLPAFVPASMGIGAGPGKLCSLLPACMEAVTLVGGGGLDDGQIRQVLDGLAANKWARTPRLGTLIWSGLEDYFVLERLCGGLEEVGVEVFF